MHVLRFHTRGQLRDHQVDDLLDLILVQWREHDRVIDAVQELGAEVLFELFINLCLHTRVVMRQVVSGLEARQNTLVDVTCTKVRGHDDDRVLEVDLASLGVGQATFFEDLQ